MRSKMVKEFRMDNIFTIFTKIEIVKEFRMNNIFTIFTKIDRTILWVF